MAASMRSPERARKLFASAADEAASASTTPRSNDSASSYIGSVGSYYSSASASSSKSNVSTNSGQKRSRRASDLASPTRAGAAIAASAAATPTPDGPGSPRVTKALFMDAASSDDSNDEDDDNDSSNVERNNHSYRHNRSSRSSGDTERTVRRRCDSASNTTSNNATEQTHACNIAARQAQSQRALADTAVTPQLRRRVRSPPLAKQQEPNGRERDEQLHAPAATPPTRTRRRASGATATAAASLPDFRSPTEPSPAPRKARVSRRHPMISPFIKSNSSDPGTTGGPPVRSRAISSVPTSPLHSPTTGKLSKHMTTNLSMTSPVHMAPKTPQKCMSGTPCMSTDPCAPPRIVPRMEPTDDVYGRVLWSPAARQKLLGRREVLATLQVADTPVRLAPSLGHIGQCSCQSRPHAHALARFVL